MLNKIFFDRYIMYGLNRRRSFFRLPKGNKIRLESPEAIDKFSRDTLKGKDCECALFYVHADGSCSAYFKSIYSQRYDESPLDGEDELTLTYSICRTQRKKDMHMFAELDGDFRFCCYSLLVEKENGLFEVCR